MYALLPVGDLHPGCYVSDHIEAKLTMQQARGLKRLAAGLDRAGATLEGGRRVVSPPDALRWLLEQIHAERLAVSSQEPGASSQRSAVSSQEAKTPNP